MGTVLGITNIVYIVRNILIFIIINTENITKG